MKGIFKTTDEEVFKVAREAMLKNNMSILSGEEWKFSWLKFEWITTYTIIVQHATYLSR